LIGSGGFGGGGGGGWRRFQLNHDRFLLRRDQGHLRSYQVQHQQNDCAMKMMERDGAPALIGPAERFRDSHRIPPVAQCSACEISETR